MSTNENKKRKDFEDFYKNINGYLYHFSGRIKSQYVSHEDARQLMMIKILKNYDKISKAPNPKTLAYRMCNCATTDVLRGIKIKNENIGQILYYFDPVRRSCEYNEYQQYMIKLKIIDGAVNNVLQGRVKKIYNMLNNKLNFSNVVKALDITKSELIKIYEQEIEPVVKKIGKFYYEMEELIEVASCEG